MATRLTSAFVLASGLSLAAVLLTSCSKPAAPVAQQSAPAKSVAKELAKDAQKLPPAVAPLTPVEPEPPPVPAESPAEDEKTPAAAIAPIKPERLIVLTPRGPLVVHLRIAIGDEPHTVVAERMLDEAFKLAGVEGKDITWKQLAENPRFASGLPGNRPLADDEARERAIENLDLNRNERVDRDELAVFLAQGDAEGHAFAVARMPGRGGSEDGQWSALSMVDEDGDGRLSADERAAAGARLLSRDADDDEVLTPADFLPPQTGRRAMNRADDEPTRAFELQPRAMESIYLALWDAYVTGRRLDADGLALVPGLLAELDTNGSRDVDQRELAGIVEARPDLVLKVGLPSLSSRGEPPTLELEKMSDDLSAAARADASPGRVTISMSDYHLDLFAVNGAAPDRADVIAALFARLDADKSEALDGGETDELTKATGLPLETADGDKDGRVSLDEIKKAVATTPIYRDTQVQVRAGEAGDPLFGWLDADNDGRLTRRELDQADKRLAELDADGDQHTSAAEIPGRLACAIGRGAASQQYAAPTPDVAVPRGANSDAPKWMVAMDINSDGEISRREFLGTSEQFAKLDANQDGFIDVAEALRAAPPADSHSADVQVANPPR